MLFNKKSINHLAWVSLGIIVFLFGLKTNLCFATENNIEHLNTFELLTQSAAAKAAGNLERAGFLFLASQARYQIDKSVYPPSRKGSNDPGVLKAALGNTVGKPIIEEVLGNAEITEKVISMLSSWQPRFADNYDPGWKYKTSLEHDAAVLIASNICQKNLSSLKQKSRLLGNQEYRELTNVIGQTQKIEQRLRKTIGENRLNGAVDETLLEEYRLAKEKRISAELRIQEITWELNPEARWHIRMGWKAEDYFADPMVVKLCKSIELNDTASMEILISQGANVNAEGKDGMTPLLWSFPDRKLERFELLLKHGANPNIYFKSNFSVKNKAFHQYPENPNLYRHNGCHAGESVTHLACRSPITEYFNLVFKHGGNPNLIDQKNKTSPLSLVIERSMPDMIFRVQTLIDMNASINRFCPWHSEYPATQAANIFAYKVSLILLQSGADFSLINPRTEHSLVHSILLHERYIPFADSSRNADYENLVQWLVQENAPFDKARAFLDSKGRPWGKAIKLQQEKKHAEWKAKSELRAKNRAKQLKKIKALEIKKPTSADEQIKTLSDQELDKILQPDDPDKVIFRMYQPANRFVSQDQHKPLITVFANGNISCGSRISPNSKPINGKITHGELVWLLHLAVNECDILSKKSSAYERPKKAKDSQLFRFEVSTKSESNTLLLPPNTLILKSLRAKLGLYVFKDLIDYVRKLVNNAHFRVEKNAKNILVEINDQLAKEHPELPSFQMQHLSLADHGENSMFICSFNQVFELGNKRFEDVSAFYTVKDGEPQIKFNIRKYSKP